MSDHFRKDGYIQAWQQLNRIEAERLANGESRPPIWKWTKPHPKISWFRHRLDIRRKRA